MQLAIEAGKLALLTPEETRKATWSIGVHLGATFLRDNQPISFPALSEAFADVLQQGTSRMDDKEIARTIAEYQRKKIEQPAQERFEAAQENLREGTKFLERNKTQEGVQVTESGLQYRVVREGTGKPPTRADRVKVHYRGTYINGEEFDNSYTRGEPTVFKVDEVIKGWTEGLLLMREGAKYELFIPHYLAYGPGGGAMPPNATLLFEVELIETME